MKFIPNWHFATPEQKKRPEWGMQVVNDLHYNLTNVSLVHGKNLIEIEEYSSGDIDIKPFLRVFKSMRKKMKDAPRDIFGNMDMNWLKENNELGLNFDALPLIPMKVNSAVATIQKIPIEPECEAQDALAMKKKEDDLKFLKSKPILENELQDFADDLGVGKVDIGETKHGASKYSDAPMGLDLSDPEEENIFSKLIYSLNVEKAFEKALVQLFSTKNGTMNRKLLNIDTMKYGVCAMKAPISSLTGMPDLEYLHPARVLAPASKLPDYSDNTHRIIDYEMTAVELMNMFSDEITSMDMLEQIILDKENGYCKCNGMGTGQNRGNLTTLKVQLKHFEVRSIDWVGVGESETGDKYLTNDEKEAKTKLWAQNTYSFYWLVGTKKIFKIEVLPFAYRTKGKESFQNFSSILYKSQPKSAVELSISENKKAIIADIKLQHVLIMAAPPGKFIDLKFIRNAMVTLKNEKTSYTMVDLMVMALEKNHFIGDSSGFEGKNDGQLKPYIDIPGGLKQEGDGYIRAILSADQNIANFTGINQQLTGQSANPEGLVGLQKLLINGSINAIYYANEATENSHEYLFNIWGYQIQSCVEKGGRVKKSIEQMIGANDTNLLDGLNESPLHTLTLKVRINQREVERAIYENSLFELKKKGVITSADEYILSSIANPKERFAYLAVKEKRFIKEQNKIRQEQYQQQQILMKQQGDNMLQNTQAEADAEKEAIYAKGEVQAKVLQLSNQLGLQASQFDHLLKKDLQENRNNGQTNKSLATLERKNQLEKQI